ncbi:MAG: hypothetical protein RR334_03160 [Clostridia bacterium]
MKKRLLIIFVIMFSVLFFAPTTQTHVYASENIESELSENVSGQIDEINFDDINNLLDEDSSKLFDGMNFKEFVSAVISNNYSISASNVVEFLIVNLKNAVIKYIPLIFIILVVILLGSLIGNIKPEVSSSSTQNVVHFIVISVVIILVVVALKNAIEITASSITKMQKQMNAIFPIMLTLLASMGGVVSATVYQPIVYLISSVISNIFSYLLYPVVISLLVFACVGRLSDNIKLTKLRDFLSSSYKWIIGTIFTIFMTFLSIKGFTAGGSDGMSIRLAKYSIKNYVPVLGGYISEGFEVVKAGSMLIKNATGFGGIVLLIITLLIPLVTLVCLKLLLKLIAGILEPVADGKYIGFLCDAEKCITLLISTLIGVALMYFLSIMIIIFSANGLVM